MPIVLDGNNLMAAGLTLSSTADGTIIRGLVIRDFASDGIAISSGSSGNTIAGNWIGRFNSDGTDAGVGEANTDAGIYLQGNNNIIGGSTLADRNVISGNADGVVLTGTGAYSNIVSGNYIGTSVSGNSNIGNSFDGILIEASAYNNTIGGATAAHGNIIVGGGSNGIQVTSEAADGNIIRNN